MFHIIAVVTFGYVFHVVTAADICGLEYLVPCDPFKPECIPKYLYPALRNWFESGNPEYFVDPIDKLHFEHLEIPVEDGAYHLHQVVVTGLKDTEILNFLFDRDYYKGSANFTYEITLKLIADSFYKIDNDGIMVTCDKPLCARLGNILSFVAMPLGFLYRCDGSQYLDLKPGVISIKDSPKTYLKYDYGKPLCKDENIFNERFIEEVIVLGTKASNTNIKQVYQNVDVNQILDFTAYYKRLEENKKCDRN